MEPRRIQQLLSCCPTAVGTYAAMNLDSLGKVLNHLLTVMLACNVLLFMNSWSVSYLPIMGFNTVLSSFLLCFQNVVVWLILNNNRISALSFLSPTQFMVGVALGITIGGSIIAFVISMAYRHMTQCNSIKEDSFLAYACKERKGSITAIWFWSGLVFWLNFCTSLLLAVGRDFLTQQSQYENIGDNSGMTMEDYEGHFRRQQTQQDPSLNVTIPSFVGDYATIPEIRSAIDEAERATSIKTPASVGGSAGGRPIVQTV